jgi:hypothetical protein
MKKLEFDAFHHRLDQMMIGYTAIPRSSARASDMDFIHLIHTSPERLLKTVSELGMKNFRMKLINYGYVLQVLRKEVIWHIDLECSLRFFGAAAMDLRYFRSLASFEIPLGILLGYKTFSFEGGSAALRDELDRFVVGYTARSRNGDLKDECGRLMLFGVKNALLDFIAHRNDKFRIKAVNYRDFVAKDAKSLSPDVIVKRRIAALREQDRLCDRWKKSEREREADDDALIARDEKFAREYKVEDRRDGRKRGKTSPLKTE